MSKGKQQTEEKGSESRPFDTVVSKPDWFIGPLKDSIHHGCLNCGGTESILSLDTRLYNDVGGWYITKDGEHYFEEDPSSDKEWEEYKPLKDIEEEARKDPDHDWRAVFFLPLRGGTYQRHDKNKWVLIESNRGFA